MGFGSFKTQWNFHRIDFDAYLHVNGPSLLITCGLQALSQLIHQYGMMEGHRLHLLSC
ncbi:hypothetical protein NC652_028674 [Populus alba x Populus x berolinensis]|nr:hypothetical protein NC652_028674 [Populus alba x Populus x berolinensis]